MRPHDKKQIDDVGVLISAAKHYRDALINGKPLSQMYADAALHRAAYKVFEYDELYNHAEEIEGWIKHEIGGLDDE